MVRLNRQLSCRCRADSLPRDDGSNMECSRSMLWPSDSSCNFPCAGEPISLRLALCRTIRGTPRQFLMVNGAFSFRDGSKVEAVASENAWSKQTKKVLRFIQPQDQVLSYYRRCCFVIWDIESISCNLRLRKMTCFTWPLPNSTQYLLYLLNRY